MSPVTKSPYWGPKSSLRQVSQSPSHFRSARWFLLAEGLTVAALGIAGLVSSWAHPGVGRAGAPVLALSLTPVHSGVLLGFGLLAILASFRRRAAVTVAGFGVVCYLLLFAIGTVAAVRHAPGPLGFDLGDSVLHAALMAVNLAVFIWLLPDALEGRAWVPRRRPSGDEPGGGP
ncbi:MAG: DUF4383 domain-containing protein [Actinomycetota bacterium]|nr:DUF4383 domain-containing protein [Actinomycetota bacterium]